MKKSPTTKRKKGLEIRGVTPDKKSSYTNKRGKTVELKRYKSKEYKRTTDPDATKETRRASRRTNTLELYKTKTKKDGTTKTRVKRAAGGTKKAERLSRQFKRGARQQGASDVKIERKSPTTMKKSPSKMKKSMATMKDKSMAKMKKSPAKKPLVGKQKNLPEHLKKAILDAPAKMLSKSGMKMMKEGSPAKLKKKESPAKMKAPVKKSKKKVEQDYARNAIADYKAGKTKEANYEKKKALEVAAGESVAKMKKPVIKKELKKVTKRVMKKSPNTMKTPMEMKKNPMMMKKNPMMMKSNQDGGAYAAKNPAAPARQLKKLGSILSKHMKSR